MISENEYLKEYGDIFRQFALAMRDKIITPEQFKMISDNLASWQIPNDISATTFCPNITIKTDWFERVWTWGEDPLPPYRFMLAIELTKDVSWIEYFDSPAEAIKYLNDLIKNSCQWQDKVKDVWASCGFSC